MRFIDRLNAYEKLIRLDKPIGILLLLWPTLWALWLSSSGHPDWTIVWIFVLGTVLMRSAGCAINDYADRDIDAKVARTRDRPLATGAIKPIEALLVALVLSLVAFALVLQLNALTIKWSVAAVIIASQNGPGSGIERQERVRQRTATRTCPVHSNRQHVARGSVDPIKVVIAVERGGNDAVGHGADLR